MPAQNMTTEERAGARYRAAGEAPLLLPKRTTGPLECSKLSCAEWLRLYDKPHNEGVPLHTGAQHTLRGYHAHPQPLRPRMHRFLSLSLSRALAPIALLHSLLSASFIQPPHPAPPPPLGPVAQRLRVNPNNPKAAGSIPGCAPWHCSTSCVGAMPLRCRCASAMRQASEGLR